LKFSLYTHFSDIFSSIIKKFAEVKRNKSKGIKHLGLEKKPTKFRKNIKPLLNRKDLMSGGGPVAQPGRAAVPGSCPGAEAPVSSSWPGPSCLKNLTGLLTLNGDEI